jgi:histidinol-phosphatase
MGRTDELRELLDFAVGVAWRAGRSTLAHYQVGIAPDTKADGSPVTIADKEAERLARELILARFPDDGLVGEEHGEQRGTSGRSWILDPIDGTRTFVRGVPFYGLLLGVLEGDEPVAGVCYLPALGETVAAATGCGCWWNGRRCAVSQIDRLDEALIVTTDVEASERHGLGAGWDRLRKRSKMVRTWSDCYGYALVATGRAEAVMDPVVAPWDIVPFVPIFAEAGGELTTWPRSGSPAVAPPVGSALGTNAALAAEVRAVLVGEG